MIWQISSLNIAAGLYSTISIQKMMARIYLCCILGPSAVWYVNAETAIIFHANWTILTMWKISLQYKYPSKSQRPDLALLKRINLILRELNTVSKILADQETVLKDFLQQALDLNDYKLSTKEMQAQSLYEGQVCHDFPSQTWVERQLKRLLSPPIRTRNGIPQK